MRGGVEALRVDLDNAGVTLPPLPLGGGGGESFATLERLLAILSPILRIQRELNGSAAPGPGRVQPPVRPTSSPSSTFQ